jgi:1,4-dihydroxy-6-naphthoate synthase
MSNDRLIKIAHSPDSDDAFMFWALATNRLSSSGYRLEHTLTDIETLNQEALKGTYEISAISFHAYPYVRDKYKIMSSGASFGDRYGPMLVSRECLSPDDARKMKIAVPGEWTTALLALRLWEPNIAYDVVPFDQILLKVQTGEYAAGLIIHEGQLTYKDEGFHKILDMGEWWYERTQLPLPLGCNIIRKDLGEELVKRLDALLKESIQMGLKNKEESIPYAQQFARGMNPEQTDAFVSMYVNNWTLGYGEKGKQAVELLLTEGFRNGLLPELVQPEFVD